MADDFQICNGGWWNTARTSGFDGTTMPSAASSVSCSASITDIGGSGGGGGFSWASSDTVEGKARSGDEAAGSCSGSSITTHQEAHKNQLPDLMAGSSSFMDASLQASGFGLSAPMIDWNQTFMSSGRAETSFHALLQEHLSSRPLFRQEIPMEPNQEHGSSSDSSANLLFKDSNQGFPLDSGNEPSGGGGYPMLPASSGYCSTLLQGSFLETSHHPDDLPQAPWAKFPQLVKSSSPSKPTLSSNQLHFCNNAPFWNASAGAAGNVRPSFYPSMPTQVVPESFEQKPIASSLTIKTNPEAVRESSSGTKKSGSEPAFKKPRVETPSPLPTFKVRKEKLGDRITALQQLVSPFGKTDTASVLHEAIDYIKFLHEQVGILSTPYLKNGNAMQQQQQNPDKSKDGEGPKQDLRSRGLCLVPIAITFPMASETPADLWTPTFGGTYR